MFFKSARGPRSAEIIGQHAPHDNSAETKVDSMEDMFELLDVDGGGSRLLGERRVEKGECL